MQLAYRKLGSGPPLIILHGLFGMSDNWLTIARRIAAKHTVFLPDQRNHGDSPHSDAFSYELLAEDLEEFIVQQGLGVVSVIGHSMGGKAAMCHALRYPQRVAKLVVVDIAPKAYDHPFFRRVLDFMVALDLSRFERRAEIDAVFAEVVPKPSVRQFILKNLQRTESGYRWQIHVKSLSENLDRIFAAVGEGGRSWDKPALFVRGGRSDYVLDEDEALIKTLFPQARLVTIPGASHWLHVDAEEILCSHLRAYLGC
ncbi:MAG TPA: alpha/beta fold hydrolase [bacterium]|nr:alpha/beta fold hydrolase [bacterium]HQG44330.1 alpha/beta fold hydrolase [bacterium]HQI48592.1 alpha/beta fold hydrolase [bacterium]HQJ63083.1 alpha/beta fold hydrolase [bacterium]